MAYIVMAYIIMAYIVMTYTVMAFIAMAMFVAVTNLVDYRIHKSSTVVPRLC